ncbi:MAG: hypothetical protein ACI9PP_001283 [Halobacteriales archaeon]|jgi:hypothetical protein
MTTAERSFRGISVRLAAEYLRDLGGRVVEPTGIDPEEPIDGEALSEPVVMEGKNWRVRLTSESVAIGPSLTLTEVSVVFEEEEPGDAQGTTSDLDDLVERFAQKAVRAGG